MSADAFLRRILLAATLGVAALSAPGCPSSDDDDATANDDDAPADDDDATADDDDSTADDDDATGDDDDSAAELPPIPDADYPIPTDGGDDCYADPVCLTPAEGDCPDPETTSESAITGLAYPAGLGQDKFLCWVEGPYSNVGAEQYTDRNGDPLSGDCCYVISVEYFFKGRPLRTADGHRRAAPARRSDWV